MHRPSGDGLAEMKFVAPNNNFDTLDHVLLIRIVFLHRQN